jgi:hypothetical protein
MGWDLVSPQKKGACYLFDQQRLTRQSFLGTVDALGNRMPVQTRSFVDVGVRARKLGCRVPAGIALLPGNFSTAVSSAEFCYHAATPQVRSAWRSVALIDEGPDVCNRGHRGQLTPNRPAEPCPDVSGDQVPLVIFFGASILGGPAHLVTVALGMVASVFTCNPICASPREVRFDVVVEQPSGGYACLEYHGDAYGLMALVEEVRGIWAGK